MKNWVAEGVASDNNDFTKQGQLGVCQLMLENLSITQAIGKWKIGPNKNPSNKINGLTPLHYAAEAGHVEICKLIMKNLVNKHPSCLNGSTPLSRDYVRGGSEGTLAPRNSGVQKGEQKEKQTIHYY